MGELRAEPVVRSLLPFIPSAHIRVFGRRFCALIPIHPVVVATYIYLTMDKGPTMDVHNAHPTPPVYDASLLQNPPQGPPPAAWPQYPPQQSPLQQTPYNLTPQQHNARIGQEYRDGRKYPFSSSVLNSESPRPVLAQCANGVHDAHTSYGVLGIICAIVFFPIGLLCLL